VLSCSPGNDLDLLADKQTLLQQSGRLTAHFAGFTENSPQTLQLSKRFDCLQPSLKLRKKTETKVI
jgi:hypothetical protein